MKEVGGERRDVKDIASRKGFEGCDVMLDSARGKGVIRVRTDVTDSERGKMVVGKRRDVTDSGMF